MIAAWNALAGRGRRCHIERHIAAVVWNSLLVFGFGSVDVGDAAGDVEAVGAVAGPVGAVAGHNASFPSLGVQLSASDGDHDLSVWVRCFFSGPEAVGVPGSFVWARPGLYSTGFSSRIRRKDHREAGRLRP